MCNRDNSHITHIRLLPYHVPYLCLCDHIQHRTDFIADQIIRPAQQGSRNAETLQFPSGKLLRKTIEPCLLDTQRSEQFFLKLAALFENMPELPARIDRFFPDAGKSAAPDSILSSEIFSHPEGCFPLRASDNLKAAWPVSFSHNRWEQILQCIPPFPLSC